MTQSTFVRLDEADLASMAKRLTVILTDEGAHAWYRHDVAELLQELVAMRQEREVAVASFREHDPLSDVPDSLPVIAAAWREQVTGLWEKAQVKKLRAEIAQGKQEISDLTADLRVAEHYGEDLKQAIAESEGQVSHLCDLAYKKEDAWRVTQAEYEARIKEHEELQAQHDSTVRAYDVKLEELRKQRTAHVERIEELEAQVSTLQDEQANEQQRIATMVKAVEDSYAARAVRVNQLLSEAGTALAT